MLFQLEVAAQCEAVRPEHLISQKHPVKLNGTFPSGDGLNDTVTEIQGFRFQASN